MKKDELVPMANATVKIYEARPDGKLLAEAKTDKDGRVPPMPLNQQQPNTEGSNGG